MGKAQSIRELITIIKDRGLENTPIITKEGRGLKIVEPCSYRGYYYEPAIVASPTTPEASDTFGVLLAALERLENETFTGYKGGDFVFFDIQEPYIVSCYSSTTYVGDSYMGQVRQIRINSENQIRMPKDRS